MNIIIRQAHSSDAQEVRSILVETATWLEEQQMPLWKVDELQLETIVRDIENKQFFLAEVDGEAAGVFKFQMEDQLFWPDVPLDESAFLHRVAVRRRFAGGIVSTAMMRWAAQRTRDLGRCYLRLDCDAARTKLRAVYERFGFRHHGDRRVGPYFVARYELPID
jgi:predicted GNAT family N-acyltransferase